MLRRMVDWVHHHAGNQPEKVALQQLETGETRSWAELDRRVGALACSMASRFGVQRGDRVVCITNGDIRWFELQFACFRIGAILAPLNFRLAEPELTELCQDLTPKLMVADRAWHELALNVTETAKIPAFLSWDDGPGSEFDTLADGADRLGPRTDATPDDPGLILFTSGTTGKSKGAITTLGALLWQSFNQHEFGLVGDHGSHVLSPLPLFHAGGLNSMANPILFFGGKVTVASRFEPARCLQFMADPAEGVTHIALVPVMYQMMAETPEFETVDLSHMRCTLIAGGRLLDSLREPYKARGVRFTTSYGGTETGPTVTVLNAERVDKARAGSCGQKAMFVDIRLVDNQGNEVAPGESGEIWLRGPAITPGYFNRDPSLDFTDGWFRTGDVARIDADGFYYIVDRVKEMYKSGGENVYPAEVEAVLADHPYVAEVAVIGIAHNKWGEAGLAVIVPRDKDNPPTLDSLRSHCDGRLARYKHPYRMELVSEFPRNVTGKISKESLRTQFGGTKTA